MAQIYTAGDRRGPRTQGRSPKPVSEVLTDVQKKRELRAKLEERGLAQAKPRPAESLKPDRQPRYVAAIDQGTTSTRFMVFDYAGQVIAIDQKEHQQLYPRPGWVEHNPLEIWERARAVMVGALRKHDLDPQDLAAVGVTNQRETTVVWDRATGQPVYNAIVWQDTRTADICTELAKDGGQDRFRAK
ncbi:MAG: glycerol kinase, partial [Anaerolineales bacterium]|nr:glycerol kinase [Anaerolineales bacterium]